MVDDLIHPTTKNISPINSNLSSILPSSSFSSSKRFPLSSSFIFSFHPDENFSNSSSHRDRLVSIGIDRQFAPPLLFHRFQVCDLIDSFALIEQQPDKRRNRTTFDQSLNDRLYRLMKADVQDASPRVTR